MEQALKDSELFADISDAQFQKLLDVSEISDLPQGQYLFLLGDHADRVFVVLSGGIEVCFPLTVAGEIQDIPLEIRRAGHLLGWSALVKPYRFTLSARSAEPSRVASISRQDLDGLFAEDPAFGLLFMSRLAEVIGRRFLTVQALWARELQRAITGGLGHPETSEPMA